MKYVMIMSWAGVTPEQYQQIRETVDWEGNVPSGALLHVAAFDDNGIRVVDLWESPEQFQAFVETRLNPGIAQVGDVEGEPTIEMFPVTGLFTPAFTEKESSVLS